MLQVIVNLAVIVMGTSPARVATIPTTVDLSTVRAIPLQNDGRYPPLDTVARSLVEKATGNPFFQGHDPVALLLAWTFDANTWTGEPLITIGNAELRGELELPPDKNIFSYGELLRHKPLRKLIDDLANIEEGRKMNPLESKVAGINEQLLLLQAIFSGRVIRAIPDPESVGGAWQPIPGAMADVPEGLNGAVEAWRALGTSFLADDAAAFAEASTQVTTALAALPAAYRPTTDTIATELKYNALNAFGTAWRIMLIGAALSALALWVRQWWFDGLAFAGMAAGFAVLTYGLWLRWEIAGRIPASNMFESLLFLSWGMGAFAILSAFFLRTRLVPLTASGMGAVALMLADLLPMNPYIRPIAPVLLDTVWMSIHVPVIMVSYSVLALGVLVAHVQLVAMAAAPRNRQVIRTLDTLHYWYIHVGSILLLAGIVTGSMWGASSWGRYWGWDPKEVWSLVALLGYLCILHVRIDQEKVPRWAYVVGGIMAVAVFALVIPLLAPMTSGKILGLAGAMLAMVLMVTTRGAFATAVKSILCFWLIIMTYVGVNYVLGIGLHSYGFGTGAMVKWMLLLGSIDLGLVAFCCVLYLGKEFLKAPHSTVPLGHTGVQEPDLGCEIRPSEGTAKLYKLAEHMGAIVVRYPDEAPCREVLDGLCSNTERKREIVRLNLVLLLAFAVKSKASILLGQDPAVVQLFTDWMCQAVFDNLGKSKTEIEPLLHNRWSIYQGSGGLQETAKCFDECCGDTIADPKMTRTDSLDTARHVGIAAVFMVFFRSLEAPFTEAVGHKRPEQERGDVWERIREELKKFEIIGRTDDGELILVRRKK